MRATIKAVNPDAVEFTITLTMSLQDWTLLSQQLSSNYPGWKFTEVIHNMIRRADEVWKEDFDPFTH